MAKITIIRQDKDKEMKVSLTQPWSKFFETLNLLGHEIVDIENHPDVVVFMNGHPKLLKRMRKSNKKIITFLVMWEPDVTRPQDFAPRNMALYDFIFSPSHLWAKGDNVHLFNWPSNVLQSELNGNSPVDFRNDTVVLIAGNKFSLIPQELYSLRRRYLKKNGNLIDTFGVGWDSNFHVLKSMLKAVVVFLRSRKYLLPSLDIHAFVSPNHYFGVAAHKSIMKRYRYSLVIENQANYVSEKIFDALVYGCIPLYVGPQLREFGIPDNVAFSLSAQKGNVPNLHKFIKENEEILKTIGVNGQKYIRSSSAMNFDNTFVLTDIARRISELIKTKRQF